MQRAISTLLATLLTSTIILPAAAQDRGAAQGFNPYVTKQATVDQPSPFNLTYLAYQGYLKDQGIPDSGTLIDAIATRTMTAQDIMQAAVDAKRLPERTLSDQAYRSDLENQLQGLVGD